MGFFPGLMIVLATLGGEPGPVELVGMLGSPDRVERDEAARTLEERGAEALPALDAAIKDGPTPVRARATTLERSIRGNLLRLPTLVPVDFAARPLAEVVADLAERSGHSVQFEPKAEPDLGARSVDVRSPTPLPFWEALDLVGRAGHIRHDPGFMLQKSIPRQTIHLAAGDPPPGTLYRGPFRVHLLDIQRRRDLNLGVEPQKEPVPLGVMYAEVQAFVEPGRWLDYAGPARVEATDDQGRRVAPPSAGVDPDRPMTNNWRFGGEIGLLQWRIPFALPDRQVHGLRRLTGTLPVIVSARKPHPLIIPLTGSGEQVGRHDGTLLAYRVARDAAPNLEVELKVGPDPDPPGVPFERLVPMDSQFAFEDNSGQPLAWYVLRRDTDTEGRTVLGLWVGDGPRPIRLSYHGLIAKKLEIPFEFSDIALP